MSSTSATAKTAPQGQGLPAGAAGENSVLHLPEAPPAAPAPPPQARQGAGSARWTRRPAASRLMPSSPLAHPAPLRLSVHEEPLDWGMGLPRSSSSPSRDGPWPLHTSALRPPPSAQHVSPASPSDPPRDLAQGRWPGAPQGTAAPERWAGALGGTEPPRLSPASVESVFRFACLSPILSQAGGLPAFSPSFLPSPAWTLGCGAVTPPKCGLES